MNWLRRAPSPEKMAVDAALEQVKEAREKKRSALQRLMRKLDEIPLDDGLVNVGNDLSNPPKGGH